MPLLLRSSGARWSLGLALASTLTFGCAKDPLSDELTDGDGDSILLVALDDSGSPGHGSDAAAQDAGQQPALDAAAATTGCDPAPSTPPSVTLSPGVGFTPPASARTERCFLLGGFDRDVYATAMKLVPEQRAQVSEAAFVVVPRAQVGGLQQLDQADPQGVGFPCDASLVKSGQTLHVYPAALQGTGFAQGEAVLIPADSGLVLRIVYDTRSPLAANVRSDETKLSLWTLAPGQLPARTIEPALTTGRNCR